MKRSIALLTCCSFWLSLAPVDVCARKIPPANFGDMYNLASAGKLGSLLAAAHRGLDLDAPDNNGDSGVCVAIKNGDYMAYNTFIKAGASYHPTCINYISSSQYRSFLSSPLAVKYSEYPSSFVPRESNDYAIMAAGILGATGLFFLVKSSTSNH